MHRPMRRAARAAAVAGGLVVAGCAVARPGGARPAPREAEPDCVARSVRAPAPVEGLPVSGRAIFEFWVEADGTPGPIETVTWVEGHAFQGDMALANEVARAISRCGWIPGTSGGKPTRALVRMPLRFVPSPEARPGVAGEPSAHEEILLPREAVSGCVPRALPLPSGLSAGATPKATFLVRVEADGSAGPVTVIGGADLDAERHRALVEAVAAAVARCRFAPGTVNGEPARTFWLVEVTFTAPAP